jgi:DNA-binding transcriptional regulator YhcF (GntR family)
MATKNSYWIKLYTGVLDNPKFMQLPDNTKWHYIGLYLMAKNSDAGGWLVCDKQILTVDDIAYQLHTAKATVNSSIEKLKKLKMVHLEEDSIITITEFEEQQITDRDSDFAKRVREQTRVRTAKSRAKVANTRVIQEQEEYNSNTREREREREEGSATSNATIAPHDSPQEDFSLLSLEQLREKMTLYIQLAKDNEYEKDMWEKIKSQGMEKIATEYRTSEDIESLRTMCEYCYDYIYGWHEGVEEEVLALE